MIPDAWKFCCLVLTTQLPRSMAGDYCYTSYTTEPSYCYDGCCSYTSSDPCCGGTNTAAIAGSLVSIFVVVVIFIIICQCCRRRRQNQQGVVVACTRQPQVAMMTVQPGYPGPTMVSQPGAYPQFPAVPGVSSQHAPPTWNQQAPPTWNHQAPPVWPQPPVPGPDTQPPPYQPKTAPPTAPPLYQSGQDDSYIHPLSAANRPPLPSRGYTNAGMSDESGPHRIKEMRQVGLSSANDGYEETVTSGYEEPVTSGYEEPVTSGYEKPATSCYEEPGTFRYERVSSRRNENEYQGLKFDKEA